LKNALKLHYSLHCITLIVKHHITSKSIRKLHKIRRVSTKNIDVLFSYYLLVTVLCHYIKMIINEHT